MMLNVNKFSCIVFFYYSLILNLNNTITHQQLRRMVPLLNLHRSKIK